MGSNVLFEIGTEEIPHEILTGTLTQLKENSIRKLNDASVEFGKLYVYGTPRRLAIEVFDLQDKTSEKVVEKKGPVASAAYDGDGKPTKALEGFLRSNNAQLSDIELKDTGGAEYVFLTRKEGGVPVFKLLPEVLASIATSLAFPKAMRWGEGKFAFVRPVRWIVAVMNGETIPVQIGNVKAGNQSTGHRLLGNKPIRIDTPEDYKTLLKEKEVIVDQAERKAIIVDKIDKTAARLKARPVLGDSLLDTLVNLTEYPEIAVGKFEAQYLDLPKEVLISEMVDHQKFVPLEKDGGELINNFIIITNTTPNDAIVKGNERVIRARFSDGKFFWEEDRKKPLESCVGQLANVSFAKGLGTLLDKAGRMEKLAGILAKRAGYESCLANAGRVARLAKADLVTGMVGEFDELQGVMGYYYALHSGENVNVAVSVKEHYYPRFSGDALPSLPEGILVSLADRIDNLFALYSQGKFVTGSKDPYALRRQTLGIIRILIEKKLHLDFAELFETIEPLYEGFLAIDKKDFQTEILGFITTRIKTVFKEYGFAYDEIEAGIPADIADIYDSYLRVSAIHAVRQSEDFENLAVAFKRVKNILKDRTPSGLDDRLLREDAEKALRKAFADSTQPFADSVAKRDYAATVSILQSFRGPVDTFFDQVLVMDEDPALRANRIALLSGIDRMFAGFIDFDKIVVE